MPAIRKPAIEFTHRQRASEKVVKSIPPLYGAYLYKLVSTRLIIAFIHYESIKEFDGTKKLVTQGTQKAIYSSQFFESPSLQTEVHPRLHKQIH